MTSKIDKLITSNELKDRYIEKIEKELAHKQLIIDKVFYYANRSIHERYGHEVYLLVKDEIKKRITIATMKGYGLKK